MTAILETTVPLDADALLEAATAQTGLSDFGDDTLPARFRSAVDVIKQQGLDAASGLPKEPPPGGAAPKLETPAGGVPGPPGSQSAPPPRAFDIAGEQPGADLKITPMQTALAWLLQRAPNLLAIPGTSSRTHLRENLAATEVILPQQALAALNQIGTKTQPA